MTIKYEHGRVMDEREAARMANNTDLIRLLLQEHEQSDQDLHCLLWHLYMLIFLSNSYK